MFQHPQWCWPSSCQPYRVSGQWGFTMEHEFLPKVKRKIQWSKLIETELEAFGKPRAPEDVAKQVKYQVEAMIREMRVAYMDLYGVRLPLTVCWVEDA